ncbi:MAG: hypothetical protein VXW15_11410 [Bdellovibrionota bacterium]|nr:hypothetical protein [Bdellovibrionota bacterium]
MKFKPHFTSILIILAQLIFSSCSETDSKNIYLKDNVEKTKTEKKLETKIMETKPTKENVGKLETFISYSEVEKLITSQIEDFKQRSINPGLQKTTFYKSGDDEDDFENFYKIAIFDDFNNKVYDKYPFPLRSEKKCVFFPAERETVLKVDRFKVITHKIKVWLPSAISKEIPECLSYLKEKLSDKKSFFYHEDEITDRDSREEKIIVYYDKTKVFFGDQESEIKNTEEVLDFLKRSKLIKKFGNLIVAERRSWNGYSKEITEITLPYNGNINRIDCGLRLQIRNYEGMPYWLNAKDQIPYNGLFKMDHKLGVYQCEGLTRELAKVSMTNVDLKKLFNKNLPKTIVQ